MESMAAVSAAPRAARTGTLQRPAADGFAGRDAQGRRRRVSNIRRSWAIRVLSDEARTRSRRSGRGRTRENDRRRDRDRRRAKTMATATESSPRSLTCMRAGAHRSQP